MSNKITIIDYKMGNLHSVYKKLNRLGIDAIITSKHDDIVKAEKIILPGVGHFKKAIENLKNMGIYEALNEAVINKQIPILGICLGMQLMAQYSEEGNVNGFGWFDGYVKRFTISNKLKYKVPHTGWNQISIEKQSKLMTNINNLSEFYFVHSYHFESQDSTCIINKTEFEYPFISAIEKNNIYGVQYHPEKSHDDGIQLLKNFINI